MKDRNGWIERIVAERLAEHDKRMRSRQAEKEARAARHQASLVERQRRELLASRLLTVQGVVERAGDVVHVVAKRLIDSSALLGRLATSSRDFH